MGGEAHQPCRRGSSCSQEVTSSCGTRPHTLGHIRGCDQEQGGIECPCRERLTHSLTLSVSFSLARSLSRSLCLSHSLPREWGAKRTSLVEGVLLVPVRTRLLTTRHTPASALCFSGKWLPSMSCTDRYSSPFKNNYLTKGCNGSKAGSYLRLIYFVYHSTLGLRLIKKKAKTRKKSPANHTKTTAVNQVTSQSHHQQSIDKSCLVWYL